jgi:transcriptional regulator with XRE-family HTH domain
MGALSEELARVLLRNRRAFRFTQADLGERIGTSGSYISSLETGKASPRVAELEEMAAHFRTTAFALLQEAAQAQDRFVPLTAPKPEDLGLDVIAADLSPDRRELAREFLLFLREREKVDRA